MGVASLNRIITPAFIAGISKGGSATSAEDIARSVVSKGNDEPISLTLQRGAQGAAAAVQSLNAGIDFINIAEQFSSGLHDVVDQFDALVKKAGKGNLTPANARLYKQQFDRLSKTYTKIVKSSIVKGRDVLDITQMKSTLEKAGLDPERVTELQNAFKKITSISLVRVNEKGQVLAQDDLIPPEAFYRALQQATRDPEAPPQDDDGSVAFSSTRASVKAMKEQVENNLNSLASAREIVERNLKLVRATGFAFLNASKEVADSDTVDDVALRVQGLIRSGARDVLSEAHNLQAMMSAGFRLIQESSDG